MELANGRKNKFFSVGQENKYYIENFDADSTKVTSNVFILSENIEVGSKVLDVGCGAGIFGKKLNEKKCELYGIDIDASAGKYAENSGFYNKVYIGDISEIFSEDNSITLSGFPLFDYIIASDILEHLADPTKFLINAVKKLKKTGSILVSVPNISNMDIVLNLMNDKFNYCEMGILDNTHLKFFTKRSFVEWIEQINEIYGNYMSKYFDCEYLGNTYYMSEYVQKFEQKSSGLYHILAQNENCNSLQILFKISLKETHSECRNLDTLLNETNKDVVELLEKSVQDSVILDNADVFQKHIFFLENELIKYKKNINWHIEKVKELNEVLAGYLASDKRKTELLDQKEQYISELEKSAHWHIEKVKELNEVLAGDLASDKRKTELLDQKEQYISELEKSVHWHIEKVKELNDALADYLLNDKRKTELLDQKEQYISELEKSAHWHIEKMKELNEALAGYLTSDKRKTELLEEKDKLIIVLEEKNKYIDEMKVNLEYLRMENSKCHKKIFEMEDSFFWKITKWLRK